MHKEKEGQDSGSSGTDSSAGGGVRPQADEQGTASKAENGGQQRKGGKPQKEK